MVSTETWAEFPPVESNDELGPPARPAPASTAGGPASSAQPAALRVCLLGADPATQPWLEKLRTRPDLDVAGYGQPNAAPILIDILGADIVPVDELLADPTVVGVVIVGPPAERPHWVSRAAVASKAIFLGVPRGARLGEWRSSLRRAVESKVPFLAAFDLRFDPRMQRLKAALSTDTVGRPLSINLCHTSRLTDDGPLGEILGDLDLIRWLTGESPIELYATEGAHPSADDWARSLTVVLRFASGAVAVVQRVQRSFDEDRLQVEVVGAKATLNVVQADVPGTKRRDADGFLELEDPTGVAHRFGLADAALDHFVGALQADDPHLAGPEDLRSALVILNAVERSLRRGRAVRPIDQV